MKLVFSVLMMALSLLIGFQQAVIVMHFKLNQAFIEEALCVNKDKPELQCRGTCHLKKQLQKAQDADSHAISTSKSIDAPPIPVARFDIRRPIAERGNGSSVYMIVHYAEPFQKIFVPPPIVWHAANAFQKSRVSLKQ